MAWTSPITWTSALVTVAQFNEQIRDNMLALKDPPFDVVNVNEGADYTTTSTSFVSIDDAGDPDLSLTITTGGGDVLVSFSGSLTNNSGINYLDFTVDGTRFGLDDGILRMQSASANAVSFAVWVEGLAAGAHTFVLQWKVSAGTGTMYAGAGTSNSDIHPQFSAREVS